MHPPADKSSRNRVILVLTLVLIPTGFLGCAHSPGDQTRTADSIRVRNPIPSQSVSSPLEVKGQARGTWFFEGQFTVRLLTPEGRTIATGTVTSQSDWMTEAFVPFKGRLSFQVPTGLNRGRLVLESANPAGKPELQQSLEIPVKFDSS